MRHVSLVLIAGLGGCAAAPPPAPQPVYTPPPPPPYRPAPTVSVQTPGVVLTAEDGSFTVDATATTAPFDLGSSCVSNPSTQDVGAAESYGARRVKVTLPAELASAAGGQTELHGLLAICGVPPAATGAATRHYALQVPASRVEQTSGGRVSLVYEPFTGGSAETHAWMLWLSATPLPPAPPTTTMSPQDPRAQRLAQVGGPTALAGPRAGGPSTAECDVAMRRLEWLVKRDTFKKMTPEQQASLNESMETAFARQRPGQVNTCLRSFSVATTRCQASAQSVQAWSGCATAP